MKVQGKSESPIVTIVQKDAPELLVEEAEDLGRRLQADKATRTQLRRLFGTMRQIEMTWSTDKERAYRELILLKPRLAYQTDRHRALRPLAKALEAGINAVGRGNEASKRLRRLVEFFEATLANSIAARGGR